MSSMAIPELAFSQDEIQTMLDNLDAFGPDEIREITKLADELDRRKAVMEAYDDLIAFAQYIMPTYLVGKHHKRLARILMALERGDKDRVCVNIAPRHGKSQLVSIFFVAWFLGRNPMLKVMLVSHTGELAVDFGRKVRNLIADPRFQAVFAGVELSTDSKSAGRWNTNQGGEFYATGVGSALAGRGADILLIDDPHSEQDVLAGNFEVFEKAYQWFTFGARTRLMAGGRVAIVATRWHQGDLAGRVIKDAAINAEADQYEVVEFPAILEVTDKRTGDIVEKALWPEMFPLEALKRTKASMPAFQWNAQYQQNPTSEEAAIIPRSAWRIWRKDSPPKCVYVIMSVDSAAEKHNRADFTSITLWGVFFNEEEDAYNIIALDSIHERYQFPELKRKVKDVYDDREPDNLIVEKKSSGVALYQELRRMGVPVSEFTPHRGSGDKVARLNSVSDIITSGMVWVPETRWADELVEEIAAFPFGQYDDRCVEEGTQILMEDGGHKTIETILPGEHVMTPAGPRRVTESGFTGVHECYEVRCDGAKLVLTSSHPIATSAGWCNVLNLKRDSDIFVLSTQRVITSWLGKKIRMLRKNWWFLTGKTTGDTQKAKLRHTGGILAGLAAMGSYIETFGHFITGLSRKVMRFITGMKITQTTSYQTSNACRSLSIASINTRPRSNTQIPLNSLNICQELDRWLPGGMGLKREKSGIKNTLKTQYLRRKLNGNKRRITLICLNLKRYVKSVASRIKLSILRLFYAQITAPPSNVGASCDKKSSTHQEFACFADQNSELCKLRKYIVPKNVKTLSISGVGKKRVYNLSVADEKCYFANNILVHNCDSTVMALMRFRKGGFIRLPSDEPDEIQYFKSRRRAYY